MGLLGKIVGGALTGYGTAQDYLTPGKGSGTATDVGRAIYSDDVVLSNPRAINPFTRGSAFSNAKPSAPAPGSAQPIARNTGGSGGQNPDGTFNQAGVYQGGGAGGGGGGAAQEDISADLAQLDEQEGLLRSLLGKSGQYLNEGLTQLDDDLVRNRNKANDQFGRAKQDFGMKREDTTRGQNNAIERNDTNSRVLANSVKNIIGRASGSGSSAYQITAPGAINRQAAQGAGEIQEDYGTNFRDLGVAEKRTEDDYSSLIEEIQAERKAKEAGLRRDLGGKDQEMLGSIADIQRNREGLRGGNVQAIRAAGAGTMDQYRAKGSEIDSLFQKYRTPSVARDVRTEAPILRDYMTKATGVQQQQPQTAGPANDFFRPRPEDDEENRLY